VKSSPIILAAILSLSLQSTASGTELRPATAEETHVFYAAQRFYQEKKGLPALPRPVEVLVDGSGSLAAYATKEGTVVLGERHWIFQEITTIGRLARSKRSARSRATWCAEVALGRCEEVAKLALHEVAHLYQYASGWGRSDDVPYAMEGGTQWSVSPSWEGTAEAVAQDQTRGFLKSFLTKRYIDCSLWSGEDCRDWVGYPQFVQAARARSAAATATPWWSHQARVFRLWSLTISG
jgi:hypothetical protein